ncbi:hypothetical protein BV25DRAFT_1916380 [Artomyces pyxidatus]|uniref:Uncharacterized protein n=1 Tax=Artomyces pyxidatus TaxID=48021 RepID=A0ACB8T243_9AGAM|nr:hypothetical protein BV25DRAFT_1916380 [Artomyces pyxidatus]
MATSKPQPPYPHHLGLPLLSIGGSDLNTCWLETDVTDDEIGNYPYELAPPSRATRGKNALVGSVRNVIVSSAIAHGAHSMSAGDVWIKTQSPTSISVFMGTEGWVDWRGNAYTHMLRHPLLPDRHLWFSFAAEFAWIKKSGLSSKRAQWKREGNGSGEYMLKRGRVGENGEPSQANVEDIIAIMKIPPYERWHHLKQYHTVQNSKKRKRRSGSELARDGEDFAGRGADGVVHQSSNPFQVTEVSEGSAPTRRRSPNRAYPSLSNGDIYAVDNGQGSEHGRRSRTRLWDEVDPRQWPSRAGHISWRNGLTTVGPYAGVVLNQEDADVYAVKKMAMAWDAVEGDDVKRSPVIYMKWEELRMEECRITIEDALSRNKTVVVEDWTFDGPGISYDAQGLSRLCGSLSLPIQYHCAAKRINERALGKRRINAQIGTTISEFLRLSNTQDACGNLLDAPQAAGVTPPFIEAIADDVWAWKVNANVGYEEAGLALDGSGEYFNDSPRIEAMEKARNAVEDPVENNVGPRFANIDCFTFRHWDIISMAGYYTWPRHDANGFCTWVSVRDGANMIRLFDKAAASGSSQSYETPEYEVFVVVLERGSTVIMPPGAWHETYAPVNTIISGGHFLCYNALHLTQWSRFYDHKDLTGTNIDHPGLRRNIARMAIGLRHRRHPINKRAFMALASMVKDEASYRAGRGGPPPSVSLNEDDIEMVVAYRVIRTVCDFNCIDIGSVERDALMFGVNWDDPGTETVRLDCLN